MQARAEVDAGVCGFHTRVEAASEDGMFVTFQGASGCEKVGGLIARLQSNGPINAYDEINPNQESVLMSIVRQSLKGCCAGCAAPVGFFKAMQVAAGLALPKDIAIHITKE